MNDIRTPEQVRPFPKAGPRNFKRSNNRRRMKSAILIATPQKNRAQAEEKIVKKTSPKGKRLRKEQTLPPRKSVAILSRIVDPNKKKTYFLSCIDANTYGLANKLFGTSELGAVTFEQVVQKLDEHYKESLHELAASYGFYQCKMKPSQSHSDLRGCDFGAAFARLIRDIIVINTPHDSLSNCTISN